MNAVNITNSISTGIIINVHNYGKKQSPFNATISNSIIDKNKYCGRINETTNYGVGHAMIIIIRLSMEINFELLNTNISYKEGICPYIEIPYKGIQLKYSPRAKPQRAKPHITGKITNSIFTGIKHTAFIMNSNSSKTHFIIQNSTFKANIKQGAIKIMMKEGSSTMISTKNSIFLNNSKTSQGGAIYSVSLSQLNVTLVCTCDIIYIIIHVCIYMVKV